MGLTRTFSLNGHSTTVTVDDPGRAVAVRAARPARPAGPSVLAGLHTGSLPANISGNPTNNVGRNAPTTYAFPTDRLVVRMVKSFEGTPSGTNWAPTGHRRRRCATGSCLKEELHYTGDRVTSVVWDAVLPFNRPPQYDVLRFDEVPRMECILINMPNEAAWGAGEPAIGCLGGAIGNAVFAATGKRLRPLPMRPADVRAAPVEG